jgi:hypothetical protein
MSVGRPAWSHAVPRQDDDPPLHDSPTRACSPSMTTPPSANGAVRARIDEDRVDAGIDVRLSMKQKGARQGGDRHFDLFGQLEPTASFERFLGQKDPDESLELLAVFIIEGARNGTFLFTMARSATVSGSRRNAVRRRFLKISNMDERTRKVPRSEVKRQRGALRTRHRAQIRATTHPTPPASRASSRRIADCVPVPGAVLSYRHLDGRLFCVTRDEVVAFDFESTKMLGAVVRFDQLHGPALEFFPRG